MKRLFDTRAIIARRKRLARVDASHYYLLLEIYALLLEKISGNFNNVLNFGAHRGELLVSLKEFEALSFENIVHLDVCHEMLASVSGKKIVVEDDNFELGENNFDLVISGMFMHHVNDLVGAFSAIYRSLKVGGMCLISLFGPETLMELKQAIFNADDGNGFVPRVSPFIHIKDAGRLIQRVGFVLPVVTSEKVVVEYSSVDKLFTDIHATAQSSAIFGINYGMTTMGTLKRIITEYERLCPDGIKATFEVLALVAMKGA
ncbi:methyltransferase domain family [Neorickettsia risticii str. Illinois]|uniref:Methyltransferase domain family n=1 Tax=Neorickettsia risticii (strain Illinois) TaxID=434131 RepID=C6V5F4_NEORI|nr:methyltransferase domain-containing protein [Neorickettsia risticii]ACT69620.1 methyltransferase domain family [Neorickettsia risticii str. Illinois]